MNKNKNRYYNQNYMTKCYQKWKNVNLNLRSYLIKRFVVYVQTTELPLCAINVKYMYVIDVSKITFKKL